MKSTARVVIVGGGVMGVGLLYSLVKEGWSDVVLVEKGELTSGSTWHAAGQCPHFAGSLNLAKIHHEGTLVYPKLEEMTGEAVSWHGCGGLRLAITDAEVEWFKQVYGVSKLIGYEAALIGPDEIKKYHPYLETFGVKMAYVTVTDGHVAPADVTNSMAAGARQGGAEIYRRTMVENIELLPTGEWKVVTDKGNIVCEHVVNAAGSYADVVGAWTGHNVPICNMLHHYLITEPVQELIDRKDELPVVRDPYSHSYLREETNGVLVGPYETEGAHVCWDGNAPTWDFENELITPELDRLMPWLEKATERMPIFANAGIKSVISGAITHTPDANFLLGPAPGPKNYWMAAGASIGVCQGAGAGKYLAQWMVHGATDINMAEFDPRRFGDWADKDYVTALSIVDYQHMYYCYRHGEQHMDKRPLRTSSLYDRLKARGAQFQAVFGWERARWFSTDGNGEDYSFRRSNWFDVVAEECKAVRETAGLMDLTTFAKFDVKGKDAESFLDRICANRIPKKVGGIMLGHLVKEGGRIESEITVTRLGEDHFYVLSAAVAQLHDMDALRWRRNKDEVVTITDVTDDFGVLALAGPLSRDILQPHTPQDLSNEGLRWLRGTITEVAGIKDVRLMRVNYVGELGWEIHAPMAGLPAIFDALMATGEPMGMRLFGAYAMNSLRMEKAYRGWGSELTQEITMIEGDMERFCRFDKEFIGKAATQASKQRGPRTQLVYMEVETTDADCAGNEPVYQGGEIVGLTTGGAYGHAVKKSLTFAFLDPKKADMDKDFAIMMFDEMQPARIIEQPAWDPENVRLRA